MTVLHSGIAGGRMLFLVTLVLCAAMFFGASLSAARSTSGSETSVSSAAGTEELPAVRLQSAEAHAQDAERAFWESVERRPSAAAYQAYLTQYPNGIFAALARVRIAELSSGDTSELAGASPPIASPPQKLAFRTRSGYDSNDFEIISASERCYGVFLVSYDFSGTSGYARWAAGSVSGEMVFRIQDNVVTAKISGGSTRSLAEMTVEGSNLIGNQRVTHRDGSCELEYRLKDVLAAN